MTVKSILTTTLKPCPHCGGKDFHYNPPEERKVTKYKGKDVVTVKKYDCLNCGAQLD